MTFGISPGLYFNTVDRSAEPTLQSPSIAAVVGAARRGTLDPYHGVSRDDLHGEFGASDPSWGFAVDSADAFLYEGKECWFKRVVAPDALYGLGLISNNVVAGAPAGTTFTPVPAGSAVPASGVTRDVVDIEITGDFVSGTSAIASLGVASSSSITFASLGSHAAVMTAIAQAVQALMDAVESDLGWGGYATVINTGASSRIIRVIGPEAVTLLGALSVSTSGPSKPTAAVREADWFKFVVSENPGDWASKLVPGIVNIDAGVAQRVRWTLSGPVLTGQTITANVNGHSVSTVFATDSNTTIAAFCTALQAAVPGLVATPVAANAGVSGNRQIVLVAPDATADLAVTTLAVTGSGSPPSISSTQLVTRIAPMGTFNFVVYDASVDATFRAPTEPWQASAGLLVDGLGQQLELDYQVNSGPSQSRLVRLKVNPLFSGTVYGPTNPTNSNIPRYLGGGDDGSLPSTQQVVQGWDTFADPETYTVRILINGGYATPEVHQKMTGISEKRRDCFSVLDMPSDYQTTSSSCVDYRRHYMDVNSRYGAIFTPDVLIYDQTMGKRRYIPPSGLVAAQFAYTDRVSYEWFAAAGLTRGIIRNALGLRVTYKEGDRDLLSPAQVNTITNYRTAGMFAIWGEYTLQYNTSALSSIPVVRLLIAVETRVADVAAYSVFEPNDKYTWDAAKASITSLLTPIFKARGFVEMPIVVCDETNNPPETRDLRQMRIDIWMKPTLPALYIKVTEVVTRQSAVVTEDIKALSGTLF